MKEIVEPFAALGYGYEKHCFAVNSDENKDGCNSCPFHKLTFTNRFGKRDACAFFHIQFLLTPEQLEQFGDGTLAAQEEFTSYHA